MTRTTTRRLVAGVLGAGLALLGTAAQAAPAPADTSVSTGRLVLEPTDRGYAGSLPVTVTYRGAQPAYLNLTVTEPVLGAFAGLTPDDVCVSGGQRPVREISCVVPGGALRPGERRRFTVDFRVLTSPRTHAMSAVGGRVAAGVGDPEPAGAREFRTLFRSTSGSLRDPSPYVWDTSTDASLTVGSTAVLARQDDGSWLGRLPVTVRSAGDAAHDAYWLEPTLPAGVRLAGIEPEEMCAGACAVPGGRFMAGEERSVSLLFRAPVEVAPGDLGAGSVRLYAFLGWGAELPDAEPTDNTATFGVTAVD